MGNMDVLNHLKPRSSSVYGVCREMPLFPLGNARALIRQYGVDPTNRSTYVPPITLWFGTIAVLDPQIAVNYLKDAPKTSRFEIEALAREIVALSPNVVAKHRWANRAWLLTSVSLIALFAMGASYLVRA
jgi:hypothetical protein